MPTSTVSSRPVTSTSSISAALVTVAPAWWPILILRAPTARSIRRSGKMSMECVVCSANSRSRVEYQAMRRRRPPAQFTKVASSDPFPMHQRMAAALDGVIEDIHSIQQQARKNGGKDDKAQPPRWPLIILRSPKGWTGPKEVDGKKVEGFWRAHQVPLDKVRE